jgi:hypothetical protein
MRGTILLLLTASAALAGPTTRPRALAPADAPAMTWTNGVIDAARPAYVPAFAAPPAASRMESERDYANRLSLPADRGYPFHYGYGTGYYYVYRVHPQYGW